MSAKIELDDKNKASMQVGTASKNNVGQRGHQSPDADGPRHPNMPNVNLPRPNFDPNFKIPKVNNGTDKSCTRVSPAATATSQDSLNVSPVMSKAKLLELSASNKRTGLDHPGLQGLEEAYAALCPSGSDEGTASFIMIMMKKAGIQLSKNSKLIEMLLIRQKPESLKQISNTNAALELCKYTTHEACSKMIRVLIRAQPLHAQVALYKEAYCSGLTVEKIGDLADRLREKVDVILGNGGNMNLTFDRAYNALLENKKNTRVSLQLTGLEFTKNKNSCQDCKNKAIEDDRFEDLNDGFKSTKVKREKLDYKHHTGMIPTPPSESETPKNQRISKASKRMDEQERSASPTFKNEKSSEETPKKVLRRENQNSPVITKNGNNNFKRSISMLHPGNSKNDQGSIEPDSKKPRHGSLGMDGTEDGQSPMEDDMDLSSCIDEEYMGMSQAALFGAGDGSPRSFDVNEGATIRNASASTQKFGDEFAHDELEDEDGCEIGSSDEDTDDDESQITTRSRSGAKGGHGKTNKRIMLDEKLRFSACYSPIWVSNYLVQAVGSLEKFDRVKQKREWVEATGSDEGRWVKNVVTEKLNGEDATPVYVKKHCGLHWKTKGLSDLKNSCEATIQGPSGYRGLMMVLRKANEDGSETEDFVKNSVFACRQCWNKSRYPENNSIVEAVDRELIFNNLTRACPPSLRQTKKDKTSTATFYGIFAFNRNKIKNFKCIKPSAEQIWQTCMNNLVYVGESSGSTRPMTHIRIAADRLPCNNKCIIRNKVIKGLRDALHSKKYIKTVAIKLESVRKALMYEHAMLDVLKHGTLLNTQKGRSPEVRQMGKLDKLQFAAHVIDTLKKGLIKTDNVTTVSYY